ncbi:hypothetical protein Pyn_34277 [Prunus yedoensis var. nudiflora]|uniref:Uncharacterized protein n=1 Tax=Prunus yedoensis var. nudiflora TaxID=2094558 RepID=A0A314YZV4_PRUYE|nr:hypothetical protein Pyn_34277 [Prunus yedoensis var. nudiflora]
MEPRLRRRWRGGSRRGGRERTTGGERGKEESHSCEDIRRAPSSGQLQFAQALRQQRGVESSLPPGWLDRRRRRHHLSQGIEANPN